MVDCTVPGTHRSIIFYVGTVGYPFGGFPSLEQGRQYALQQNNRTRTVVAVDFFQAKQILPLPIPFPSFCFDFIDPDEVVIGGQL